MQTENEDRIQDDVQDRAAHHDEHGLHRIAGGTDESREVEGHGGEEHAGQHDVQVFARIRDGLLRGSEASQDSIHEDIAARNEENTQYNGENHAVAKNLLGPVHIFPA